MHSECVTGDTFGSLRCDCGEQLQAALTMIERSGRGALLYLRQEGRGIGLTNKTRAYRLQERGLDTVEANLALGLPADARDYRAAAAVLRCLGARRVRLLTNNPRKCEALRELGIEVVERVSLQMPANGVNGGYLRTKAERMGHLFDLDGLRAPPEAGGARPRVTVHYAQTLDGRIATRTGNSQWISGQESLRLAHELRAANDAVLVGVGTAIADNPRLTVRLVPGPQPLRAVIDSTLRIPLDSAVLTDAAAPTLLLTTSRAPGRLLAAVRRLGASVVTLPSDREGRVDLRAALEELWRRGKRSVLIEGGAGIITSAIAKGLLDRLTVCVAPKVVGAGIEAVGNLDILRLDDAVTFDSAGFRPLGPDVIFEGTVKQVAAHS
jgi:3,4-dihydroxy 2-butanone 4-phosphate synthase/GTP cyclohydrolase II